MPSISNSLDKPALGVYSHVYLEKAEKHVFRQITGVESAFEVHVFYQELRNIREFPLQNLNTVLPGQGPLSLNRVWRKYVKKEAPFVYRGCLDVLLDELQFWNIQLLHIYFGYYAVQLLPVFDAVEIPVVVSFHGRDATASFASKTYTQQVRQVFEKAALIFVRSEQMGNVLKDQGCPSEKIRVTRAPLDLTMYSFQHRPYPSQGPVRFVQACRLIPKKGLDTLLDAFALVNQRFPQAKLDIIGSGQLETPLKNRIARMGLTDSVTLHGYMETPQLIDTLKKCHLFVHPSETAADGDQEGIPNAIIEAMALGLPVIATHHGGIPELITPDESGILVPEKDIGALATAMIRLLEHPDHWENLAKAGRKAVENHHELEHQMERLTGYYRETLALGKPKPAESVSG